MKAFKSKCSGEHRKEGLVFREGMKALEVGINLFIDCKANERISKWECLSVKM